MNDTHDSAFEPMDKAPSVARVNSDGTISYRIVEGDVYLDDQLVDKSTGKVKYVQDDEIEETPEADLH